MQFAEQYSNVGPIRMADSTTKNDPITPWLHRASEAESTLGNHVSEMVGEVVIGTPKPIATLVHPSPVGKRMCSAQEDPTSPMVRRASGVGSTHMSELDETLDELYADAMKIMPRWKNATPRNEIAMPKQMRSTPKGLGTNPLDVSGSPLDVPLNHFMKKKKFAKKKLYFGHRSSHLEEAK